MPRPRLPLDLYMGSADVMRFRWHGSCKCRYRYNMIGWVESRLEQRAGNTPPPISTWHPVSLTMWRKGWTKSREIRDVQRCIRDSSNTGARRRHYSG
jgi:hypothetical protein